MTSNADRHAARPDYAGGGIVNLMASLIRARGGQADVPDLTLLPARMLADARHVILLIIDGLGAEWLQRHSPNGLLASHRRGAITSVFPPTTATAITSYLTGDAPRQHGLTGWYTWLGELGCVMTVLPGRPRYGGVGYSRAGIDAARLFGHRPVFDRMGTATVAVSPAHIASSDFNRAHLGRAQQRTFETLKGMFKEMARSVRRARERSYVYAYWPGLDSIGHDEGIDSPEALNHLRQLEQGIADFVAAAAGTDTALLVCADHGQIDTTDADGVLVGDHPVLADCLALPLCGEPRAAFCYVRAGMTDPFERYVTDALSERFELYRSSDIVDWLGPGDSHPRLAERIGDYTLLARGNNVIRDQLPFEDPAHQVGVHGGLSTAELMVPLCLIQC
jgi:hypothetical protein